MTLLSRVRFTAGSVFREACNVLSADLILVQASVSLCPDAKHRAVQMVANAVGGILLQDALLDHSVLLMPFAVPCRS